MTDIASTDVTLERPNGGNDLLIVDNTTGAVVTVAGHFAGRALANITFSDGVSYASGDIGGVLVAELARYLSRRRIPSQRNSRCWRLSASSRSSMLRRRTFKDLDRRRIVLGSNATSVLDWVAMTLWPVDQATTA